MESETAKRLEKEGLLPVLRARTSREALALADAMVAGGVTVIEVTMTVPGATEVLRQLKSSYGGKLLLGAGTVINVEQCVESIESGAEFVVSPSLRFDVIEKTKELGKVSIPGALTPTEVISAWEAGGDFVKVFPCSAVGGANYIKALKAPFPFLRLIPTGGVTLKTAAGFLEAGASALGIGSDLVNTKAIAEGTPEVVIGAARGYLEVIAKTRFAMAL